MAEDRNGFELEGKFYPWPDRFGLTHATLIREVTGIMYTDFIRRWEAMTAGDEDFDPEIICGAIAVAVARQNRDWPRAKVVRFIEDHDWEDIETIGGDEEVPEHEDPSQGVVGSSDSATSSTTPSDSNGGQEDRSALANRMITGPLA